MPTLRWPAASHAPDHRFPVLSALPGDHLGGRYGAPPAQVVALHGWRRTHADFDGVLAGLDATAPDLPGFGAAPPPPVSWGSADYAEALLPLTSEALLPLTSESPGHPAPVLLGHSFGGKVAVALAAAYPDRVAALVLTGAPLLRPQGQARPSAPLAHRLARRLNRAGLLSDARMESRRRGQGSEDYRAATGVMRDVLVRSIAEMDEGVYRQALARITCHVELVWGEHDTAAPPAVAAEAAALLGDATVTVLPGVGHLTPTEAPEALRAAIIRAQGRDEDAVTALDVVAVVLAVAATAAADLRWLRVAQREHYLAGSATRFALRWWGGFGPNRVLGAAAVIGVVLSPLSPIPAMFGAVAVGAGPLRFPLRGRSPGPVVWTTRLRTVAAVTVGIQVVVIAAATLLGGGVPVSALVALLSPLAVDAALAALQPLEDRKAETFVRQARARLADVHPTVVAITGSYGKTTTKVYLAHLLRDAASVVASPASFNNRAGLSRAINEGLSPGTGVFIAEMGTYGPGEIAELCTWCPPRIAAITAIGPVHLERFGSEDRIVEAKSEIFGPADTAVLNVDDPRLAAVADTLAASKTVVRVSAVDPGADVCARLVDDRLVVTNRGEPLADVPAPDAVPGNVAVAVALALAAGAAPSRLAQLLSQLPSVPNRRARTTLSSGATAIDDTFNSNPAGCRAALADLRRLARDGAKRIVVTPGMVELGPRQGEANRAFATEAASTATHLVVVGFTNRRALLAGVADAPAERRAEVVLADHHAEAVEWVKAHTAPGDVVLYENQLPDHYP